MIGLHEARLLAHIARWRLTWERYDLDEAPPTPTDGRPLAAAFMTAREAAALIPDGAVCACAGMAGHHRPSVLFWAIRDRYRAERHPAGLTWCAVSAQGGRGKIPGTTEELGEPGLVTTFITGHPESFRSFGRLADAGALEVHALPQGEMAFLIETQAAGGSPGLSSERVSATGVGTFLDPRVGPGSPVTPGALVQLVEPYGDALRYHLPAITVGIFNAPYADRHGNIYVHDAACLTEMHDIAAAAHANGGLVLACVSAIIEPGPDARPYIPADQLSAIVVSRRVEQTASVPQRQHWPMFTVGGHVDEHQALGDIRFINDTLRVTPRRTASDDALARLAAATIVRHVRPGALVNIGVGLPEEAARHLYESGLSADLTQTTETGCVGGIPTSGVFFGSTVNPQRHESSAWVFHRYAEGLELSCLGALEVDAAGNVNVSSRGDRPSEFVGPGGFMDIARYASTLVFCCTFANRATLRVHDGAVTVLDPGTPKFVEKVRQVTFNAAAALAAGQRVHYVTDVGALRLTPAGLELVAVFPGIDIEADILARSGARIVLPAGGRDAVEVVPRAILTGQGFRLSW